MSGWVKVSGRGDLSDDNATGVAIVSGPPVGHSVDTRLSCLEYNGCMLCTLEQYLLNEAFDAQLCYLTPRHTKNIQGRLGSGLILDSDLGLLDNLPCGSSS